MSDLLHSLPCRSASVPGAGTAPGYGPWPLRAEETISDIFVCLQNREAISRLFRISELLQPPDDSDSGTIPPYPPRGLRREAEKVSGVVSCILRLKRRRKRCQESFRRKRRLSAEKVSGGGKGVRSRFVHPDILCSPLLLPRCTIDRWFLPGCYPWSIPARVRVAESIRFRPAGVSTAHTARRLLDVLRSPVFRRGQAGRFSSGTRRGTGTYRAVKPVRMIGSATSEGSCWRDGENRPQDSLLTNSSLARQARKPESTHHTEALPAPGFPMGRRLVECTV